MGRRSYHQLRDLIESSLREYLKVDGRIEVEGKIHRVTEGIWHDNYWFWVSGENLTNAQSEQAYFLRLLQRREEWQLGPEPLDRLVREAKTLQVLDEIQFMNPTPKFLCFVLGDDSEPIGMIETALPGFSLGHHRDRAVLRLVARVAAQVHNLDAGKFGHLQADANRHEHVQSALKEIDDALFADFRIADEVRDWISSQETTGPCCVLHGDLLPQNILGNWPIDEREQALAGIIDWEMACIGDPAYDLAIVTRGDRKVLGVRDGIKALVAEYGEAGGKAISIRDVRVHELILVLRWLEEAWREYQTASPSGHRPNYYETKLRSVFRQVGKH